MDIKEEPISSDFSYNIEAIECCVDLEIKKESGLLSDSGTENRRSSDDNDVRSRLMMEADMEESRSPSPTLMSHTLQPEKEFILTFETLPELWDPSNQQYTNKYKRIQNLGKLLPILRKIKPNANVEDVKRKINTLRSNYRRELHKIIASKRSGVGAEQVYSPKIWYFPYLHFLQRIGQPLLLEQEWDTTNQSQPLPEVDHSNLQSISQQTGETSQKRLNLSSVQSTSNLHLQSTKKKKITHEELPDRTCRHSSEPYNQIPNPITLEWSNILERLDPIQRLYAKKAINDILFEAELGNLNKNSLKINDTQSCQQNGPVIFSNGINSSPHSHYSSPNNSSLASSPPPQSPLSQHTMYTVTSEVSNSHYACPITSSTSVQQNDSRTTQIATNSHYSDQPPLSASNSYQSDSSVNNHRTSLFSEFKP